MKAFRSLFPFFKKKKKEDNQDSLKIEDYTNKVGRSERTNSVIEPKLSLQWFMKMKDVSKPALENVMNDVIESIYKWKSNPA